MRSPTISSRRAFTLIELLVVISILAILMAMLFPAVSRALDNAKRTQAKNDATQIAAAIVAYQNEYGKLPPGAPSSDSTQDTSAIFDALSGTNTATDVNPRGIVFFTAPRVVSAKNGRLNGTGPYYDPWGRAYWIAMDVKYENAVKGPDNTTDSATIQKTAIVWSKGNPKYTSDFKNPAKYIKSWQ